MVEVSAPRVWAEPQWACDGDVLEFGDVRPDHPVERAVVVRNVGGGAKPLRATLRSRRPWLELRAGEDAAWSESVEVQLAPGESALLLCRANPSRAASAGGDESAIEVQAESACPVSPLTARAHFLQPRYLLLEMLPESGADGISTPPGAALEPQFIVAPGAAADGRALTLECVAAPLGSVPAARVRVRRSDGQPVSLALEDLRVTQGKAQWVDCRLDADDARPTLHLLFFTANRRPGQVYEAAFELRDADELVEPARLTLRATINRPPILEFTPLRVTLGRGLSADEAITLSNVGEGDLKVEFMQVASEHRGWLKVTDPGAFVLAPQAEAQVRVRVSAAKLGVGLQRGHVEVHCNHHGRRVVRRVPVALEVSPRAVRVERQAAQWQRRLEPGQRAECSLTLSNEGATPVPLRLVAWDPSRGQGAPPWLSIAPATLDLAPGARVQATVTLDTRRLPAPSSPLELTGWVAVQATDDAGIEQTLWQEKIVVDLQPRSRRWKVF